MELNQKNLADRSWWETRNYRLPQFSEEEMKEATRKAPVWVHFGVGNIFRAFHCSLAQRMLDSGRMSTGIVAVEGFDYEIVTKAYRKFDNLSVLVTLKSDGDVDKTVIGSIAESAILNSEDADQYEHLRNVFRADSLQMATFTITEKGYQLKNAKGEYHPDVERDFSDGPLAPMSYLGKVSSLLYARYQAGRKPIAMVSTDNCSGNGERLFQAVDAFARAWSANGKADPGFCAYIEDPACVSFPWSMIDKITPRPDASVEKILQNDGLEGLDPVITSRHSYVAPFVNAEESEYLVVEDSFPNGRPALENAGVIFTDRDRVQKTEKMKVSTCLNPVHTALAVFGCLLGFQRISEEMKDSDLRELAYRIGRTEGLPVVTDPGVVNPSEFLDTVLKKRLPNPFMPDTPQRIATDTSMKMSVRFGETIRAYLSDPSLDVRDLHAIPLVIAGWCRYLTGVDDSGAKFEISPDPVLAETDPVFSGLLPGQKFDISQIRPLLHSRTIFGVDLYEAGLGSRIESYFTEMMEGPGAVRSVLHRVVSDDPGSEDVR